MPYKKPLPHWEAAGIEPPLSLRTNGWQVSDKPPAEYFNWIQNTAFIALQELQQYALHSEQKNAANGLAPLDSQRKVPQANLYDATTSIKGITKLNDSTASTSTTEAATPRAVKAANDNANTRIPSAQRAAPGGVATLDGNSKVIRDQIPDATPTDNGGMSAADKTKLNGIEEKANNYTHPDTHPASMIVQDPTRRMVSDTQINSWNAKETPGGARDKANSAETNAKKHADTVAAVAETNAKNHATAAANSAESNAKKYADNVATTKANAAETNAKNAANTALNTHKNDKGNPHGVTSEQVNVIERYTKKHDDEARTYPMGHSVTFVRAEDGWFQYGTVETWRSYSSGGGTLQIYTPYAPHMGGKDLAFRIANYTDGNGVWGEWRKFETQDGAQEKAKQAENNAKNASVSRNSNSNLNALLTMGAGQRGSESGATPDVGFSWAFGTDRFSLFGRQAATGEKNGLVLALGDNTDDYFQIETVSPGGEATPQKLLRLSESEGLRSHVPLYENDKRVSTTEDAQKRANTAETNAKNALNSHTGNKSNPHGVTKSQVGLGNVDNAKQATKSEFDSHTGNKSNPHGVTKSQVGLGNVDNAKQATKTEFDAHTNNRNNPHNVTADQVGRMERVNADVKGTNYPLGATFFQVNASQTGWPEDLGTVYTVNESDYRCFQFFFASGTNANNLYMRNYRADGSGNWSAWDQIERSAGAQTKATKAKNDAVTAFKAQGLGVNNPGELTNLNDATVTGWHTFASGATNAPRAAAGVVETIYFSSSYAVQKAYLVNSRVAFLRVKSGGTWRGWLQTAGNMEEGWQELAPRSGATYWSNTTHPQVLRLGDHVFVRGALTNITSRGFLALTLPGYARPSKTVYRVQNTSTDGYKARFARWRIEPSGDIYCEYNSDDRWEAGKWFPVDFDFPVTS